MAKSTRTTTFREPHDDSGDNKKHLFMFRLNKVPVTLFSRTVTGHDYDRLRACMSNRTSNPTGHWDNRKLFILFDSIGYRCALNTACISVAQFLFNPGYIPLRDEQSSPNHIRVFLVDGSSMMTFDAKTQRVSSIGSNNELSELEALFYDLDFQERYVEDFYSVRTICFTDADGKIIYINADDIAFLEVPLAYVET